MANLMIHPTRAQFPTTAQEIARLSARHIHASEPVANITATKVFCTNPDAGPGFRHYSVSFLTIKPSFNTLADKPVDVHSLETYNGKNWDRYSFTV